MLSPNLAIAVLTTLIMGIAGCATTTQGSLPISVSDAPEAAAIKIATDSVQKIAQLYLPASTQFNIVNPESNTFGSALVAGLRAKGYAIKEHSPTANSGQKFSGEEQSAALDPRLQQMQVGYVLDAVEGVELYRLSLSIGAQQLSRAYLVKQENAYAAGSWVRKE
jgi:hypothetical protein